MDFTDVFLTLLPDGSLWDPSEEIFTYGSETQSCVLATNAILGASSWVGLSPKKGDLITVEGSAVGNDGTYTVTQDWSDALSTLIYVDAAFTTELFISVTLTRTLPAGDLKRLLMGCADNHEDMQEFLETLAYLRDPQNTPILADLEKEYGFKLDSGLTEAERRDRLDALVYAPAGTGAASYMQAQLHAGGFTSLYVYQNDKSTDPGAFFGGPGGEMITNPVAYDRTITEARKNQNLWPFVFFIGGTAYYDAYGRIVHIDPVSVSDALKPAFREIVLQCKPVHAWAVAVVNDYRYFTFSDDDTAPTSTTQGFASEDGTTGGYWYEDDADDYYSWVFALLDDDTDAVILDDDTGDLVIDG